MNNQKLSESSLGTPPATLCWLGGNDGTLRLLDQTRLPGTETYLDCETPGDLFHAIRRLSVRGAPAIGVAAAYGVLLGVRPASDLNAVREKLEQTCDYLASSRPTAVNLFWALDRMRGVGRERNFKTPVELKDALLAEARQIEREDQQMCADIGLHGAPLLPVGGGVLTHCNAGALATAGAGTALSVIFAAHDAGRGIHVYADETRPLLQGARLTMWELMRRGVPATLICDSVAGQAMKEGRIQAVVTGADRIAANGDAANKIGTYGVAVLARAHGIPFYIAAPSSTFDLSLETGDAIPIEQRSPDEVTEPFGTRTAPVGAAVYSPAFDVTPAELIAAIITERGVIETPDRESVGRMLGEIGAE